MSNMFLNIVSTFKGDGIKQATNQLGAFSGKMGSIGSILGKATAGLAAFGATAKAVEFGQEAITQARDLERNMYGMEKVFGSMSPVMKDFVENASSMGLSQSEAAKASTFLGSVLKQSGFAMTDVATETEKLVKLGVDLSTLYGYDVQEALLGMTALFRGEYDPIEKFGVAMKQSEINSELAAKGLDDLTGSARRNAEQVIRLELLYQRSADAIGAFDEQTGGLYASQKVLGATFRDMQAAVGTALIPSITALNIELTNLVEQAGPGITKAFEFIGEVITNLVRIFGDALDASTPLGDAFFALGARFESLFQTIFGKDFDMAIIFDLASEAIRIGLTLLHDFALAIQNIITFFQVLGEQIGAFWKALTTGDWKSYFDIDWNQKFKDSMDANAAAINNASASMDTYGKKMQRAAIDAKLLAGDLLTVGEAMFLASPDQASSRARRNTLRDELRRARNSVAINTPAPSDSGSSAAQKETGPTGIFAWIENAKQEAAVAAKQAELISKGLPEAVAKSIASGTDAIAKANDALWFIAQGAAGHIAWFTDMYNNSTEGMAAAAAETARIQQEAADALAEAQQREKEILEKRQRAFESFSDSVKGIFGGIKESIMSAFTLPELGNSVNSITRNIKKLLERTKAFAANISSLSQQGLSDELLQQVIAAGPMAGGRLAQALAGAGGATISELNQAYGEFGSIASDIAGVGTRSQFGNAQVVNTYNIEVNGGVGSGPTIGRAIVDAIKSYERTSGAVWQGA